MRRIAIWTLALGLLGLMPALGVGAPGDLVAKRAEVAEIQSQLTAIDAKVEDASNAFNGAQFRLGEIEQRIRANQQATNENTRVLAQSRIALADRLRDLYRTPEPSLAEVILDSGSLTDVVERVRLLDRAGESDGAIVANIRDARVRLKRAAAELERDRERTETELEQAEAERSRVTALLAERQAVLNRAQGELGRLLAEEQARERREAARRAAAARRLAAATTVSPSPQASGSGGTQEATASNDPVASPPPASGANAAAASAALQYLGVPYRWGGADPSGFDCSGLCSYVYGKLGKDVPHYTGAIWAKFPKVASGDLQPGDMVFFRGLGHMGIYIGGGNYVHAPSTGDVVKVSPVSERSDYVGAVRP